MYAEMLDSKKKGGGEEICLLFENHVRDLHAEHALHISTAPGIGWLVRASF